MISFILTPIHFVLDFIHTVAVAMLVLIDMFGYWGIIFLMSIESSFIPFPSEVIVPAAGYLASQGTMNIYLVVLSSIVGSLIGAYVNYFLGLTIGRKILYSLKIPFLKVEYIQFSERFFANHENMAVFIGRLVPVVRQYISFPAGFVRMSLLRFTIFTALGAGIWSSILAYIGYYFGNNQEAFTAHLDKYSNWAFVFITLAVIAYISLKIYISKVAKREKI